MSLLSISSHLEAEPKSHASPLEKHRWQFKDVPHGRARPNSTSWLALCRSCFDITIPRGSLGERPVPELDRGHQTTTVTRRS